MNPITCVVVEAPLTLGHSFPRCVADVFTPGVLTISSLDNEYVMRTFGPGQWTAATVYDERLNPIYWLTAPKES